MIFTFMFYVAWVSSRWSFLKHEYLKLYVQSTKLFEIVHMMGLANYRCAMNLVCQKRLFCFLLVVIRNSNRCCSFWYVKWKKAVTICRLQYLMELLFVFFYSPFSEQKESVFAMKSALDKASVKLNIIAHILQMKAVEG